MGLKVEHPEIEARRLGYIATDSITTNSGNE